MTLRGFRDVEIRHLVALRAVAEERSFGRAAERLGFTQSAISQQIAALEHLIGEQLFHRPGGPKPVEVTAAGRLVLEHAGFILDRLALAEDELKGYRTGTTGRLVVGTYQSVSVKVLPEVIARLRPSRPELDIRPFESDDNDLLLSLLMAGELDLTFTVAPIQRERVQVIDLCVDPFVVVSLPDFEAGKSAVPVDALVGVGLVGCHANDACQNRIDAGLRAAGVEPRYVFRSSDNAAIQAMVRAGTGQAVMPLLGVDMADKSVLVRPTDPPLPPRTIALALAADRPLPPSAEPFIEMTKKVAAEVQSDRFLPPLGEKREIASPDR